jgi:TonB family protein
MGACRSIGRCVAVALCVVPVGAHAADELVLEPSTNWIVDYGDDSCALLRTFRAGEERVTLEMRQFEPGEGLRIAIVSDTLARSHRVARTRFEPDEAWIEHPAPLLLSYGGDDKRRGVLYSDTLRPSAQKAPGQQPSPWLAAEREAREAAITSLALTGVFDRNVTLRTGAMTAPMNAMRACLDELLTHWGLDAETQRTLSRKASPIDQQFWSRRIQTSFPESMTRRGLSGAVHIRLTVGADGKPTACAVQLEIAHPAFEKAACKSAMSSARFEPALDARGEPVISYFTTTVVYRTFR